MELRDRPPMRAGWTVAFIIGGVLGVRPARSIVATVIRSLPFSEHHSGRMAYRVSRRLSNQNRELVKVPNHWSDDHPLVEVRRMGLRLTLDLRDNLQALVFYTGTYEPAFTRALRRELKAGDVYVDVGAHIGVHALRVARRLRQLGGGRVVAFEPAPDSASKLRQAAERNHLEVDLVPAALSDRRAEATLYADSRYSAADAGVRSLYGDGRVVACVPLVPLDDWARENGLNRMDIMKVDVEGHEHAVLSGAAETITRLGPRLIYLEMKDNSLGRAPVSDVQLGDWLRAHGYEATGENYDHNAVFRPTDWSQR